MKRWIEGIRIAWAVRPISDRALRRRIRRNAADAEFWEEASRGIKAAMRGLGH